MKKGLFIGAVLLSLLIVLMASYSLFLRGFFAGFIPLDVREEEIINSLILPEGFKISVYAQVPGARSLALGREGTVFVGTRSDAVFAITPEKEVVKIAGGLNIPNGVAFRDGDLYVAEINRILKFSDIENNLESGNFSVVFEGYPSETHHGWKYIAFGPDDLLYVPVGAPCNICNPDEPFASITRINVSNPTHYDIVARGVRNTVGFDWNPSTGELWFTDNGRDWLGDDFPPDELNKISVVGSSFGYPYCHGNNISDPDFGEGVNCHEFAKPVQELGPHVASLGMKFYEGSMFKEEYFGQVFIAEHGSWNRNVPTGYRISLVRFDDEGNPSYEVFASGWLKGSVALGRPVDILMMPDGSMLVSDDKAGLVYRIIYEN